MFGCDFTHNLYFAYKFNLTDDEDEIVRSLHCPLSLREEDETFLLFPVT